jgi:SAM-dependent methyltransferase
MSASLSPAVPAARPAKPRALRLVPAETVMTALPASWDQAWGEANEDGIADIRTRLGALADGIACSDERERYSALVGSADLASHPIHRWYYYKEAFSPKLPGLIVQKLGAGKTRSVADVCAGVGTSLLSLQTSPDVEHVLGVEYSPFAHFAATTKLNWWRLGPRRLRAHIDRLTNYEVNDKLPLPELAAFSNEEILRPAVRAALVSARAAIQSDAALTKHEQAFFLLGLAAIIEDVSGVMKDGRALRIRRDRIRKQRGLTPRSEAQAGDSVRVVLRNQWLAMLEDVVGRRAHVETAKAKAVELHRGDARELSAFEDQSIGLCSYSPPYLNCIDYTEVYKLELWLLELVRSQEEFRQVRLGTLRSHPSVKFDERNDLDGVVAEVVSLVDSLAGFLEERLPRPGTGVMVKNYFSDVYAMLVEQARVLEPGGHFACVVGNSTFSRRDLEDDERVEKWRMPILTDVIVARLAEAAGFAETAIWHARDLRPRNVGAGAARESIVVGRR